MHRPSLVDNAQIKSATLHNPLPIYAHLYVWPFLLVWPVFLAYYLSEEQYNQYIGAPEWTFVWTGTIVTFQSLAWLSTKWSVDLNALFTSTKAQSTREASLIKVHPVENAGASEICQLERDTVSAALTDSQASF